MRRLVRAVGLALAFLTICPVRFGTRPIDEDDLAASRWAYPAVGAGLGLVLSAASLGLERTGLGSLSAAVLLVATGAILVGGLHLDGLADSADGLFLGGGRERRLAVMKDPHVGSYGVVAMVLVMLGKCAVLAELAGRPRALGLLGAATVGRLLVLVTAGSAPYARPEGTGRFLIGATGPFDAVLAAVLAGAVGGLLAGVSGLAAALGAAAMAWGMARLAHRRVGGVTGDILGAVVELGELVYLLGLRAAAG